MGGKVFTLTLTLYILVTLKVSIHIAVVLLQKHAHIINIPLQFKVENYNITPKSNAAFRQLNKTAGVTKLDVVDITSLEKVKFGFGLSRGGMHTWVFSSGNVYEVHWDKIGEALYEATPLRRFPWLSGAIVIPSDQAISLAISSKLKCGA